MGKRTFHLVDIENCCRSGLPSRHDVEAMLARYERATGLARTDHGLASVNRSAIAQIAFALPSQLRWVPAGIGPDAADRALLAAIDEDHVGSRYDQLVIGSGDHAFAPLASRMTARGTHVLVVAHSDALNSGLAMAASEVRRLDEFAAADATLGGDLRWAS